MAEATNDKPASRTAREPVNAESEPVHVPPPEPSAGSDHGRAAPCPVAPADARLSDRALPERLAKGGGGRWWMAVVVGLAVSAPFVWLLSYGAALPYYLGLFFFVLFGLVIGAVMHRIAAPGRPYGRGALLTGTTIVVLAGWWGTIVFEARGFPSDMAEEASKMARRTINDVAAFRSTVTQDVRRYLREAYPPGGTFGYVRWILSSGELPKGDVKEFHRTFHAPQRRIGWAVRIVLSLALYAFGIGSQTLLLQSARERTHRVIDDKAIA